MSDSIPKVTGPKLFPFDGDLEDAEFIKILNPSEGIHGRVFKIAIKDKRYALKVVSQQKMHHLTQYSRLYSSISSVS